MCVCLRTSIRLIQLKSGTLWSVWRYYFNEDGYLETVIREVPSLEIKSLEKVSLSLGAKVDSLEFLTELPNLHELTLREADRQSLFSKDSYPQIKCLVISGDWLRNQE